MDFGIFMDFLATYSDNQADVFRDAFELVDLAEEAGLDSVWLGETHFNPTRSVLSAPIVVSRIHRNPHQTAEGRDSGASAAPYQPPADSGRSGDRGPDKRGPFRVRCGPQRHRPLLRDYGYSLRGEQRPLPGSARHHPGGLEGESHSLTTASTTTSKTR